MRSYRLLSTLLLIPAAVACGGDGKDKPDAFIVNADAPIDTPPPPPGCEYGELHDDINDDATSAGQAEQTMVTFNGTSAVFCGAFNIARYDMAKQKIDADAYTVSISADTYVYISLYGAGLAALGEVDLQIYGGSGFQDFVTSGTFLTNHAVVIPGLATGTYEIYVRAYNPTAPASDIPYKVKVTTDDVDMRCAPVTTGGFAEAGDGASNLSNDVIAIDFAATDPAMYEMLTPATDTPEASALTIADGMKYRFTGTAQSTNPVVGSYKDRDTFEITTGPNTNELTVRAGWADATADLDLFVFDKVPAAGMPFEFASSAFTGMGPNDETVTFAVKPSTPYWIWIGNYKDSTGPGAYSTTICGVNYTPPTN